MSVFRTDCPYCGTRAVSFTIVASRRVPGQPGLWWHSFATCGHCTRGILATFKSISSETPEKILGSSNRNRISLETISPSPLSTGAPEHTPENVAEFYRQGMENLQKNYDAAGSMFRKVLDTGLKAKFPEIKGDLKKRIVKAADQHELTPDLAEWAHQIRLDGNDATHEEEPFSEEDAMRLQSFTALVLIYLFNLPGMLKEARNEQTDGG